MSGAVGIIHSSMPQMHPRETVELRTGGTLGEGRQRKRDVALEHAGEAVLVLGARLAWADPHGAGDVGGAIEILPARIDQIDRVRRDCDVGGFIHFVVRAGGMRPGGRDRIERQIAQQPGVFAEGLQACRSRQLVELALMCLDAEPVEEPGDRRSIARLRRALPGLFDRVLDRLGQHGRVGHRQHRGSCLFQSAEHRRHRTLGIDRDLFARERL